MQMPALRHAHLGLCPRRASWLQVRVDLFNDSDFLMPTANHQLRSARSGRKHWLRYFRKSKIRQPIKSYGCQLYGANLYFSYGTSYFAKNNQSSEERIFYLLIAFLWVFTKDFPSEHKRCLLRGIHKKRFRIKEVNQLSLQDMS